MKNRVVFLIFLLFAFSAASGIRLFAGGQAEESEIAARNNEWVLCVTDFDASSMPVLKLSAANVIKRKMVDNINVISYRTRVSPEYAYYEGYAWARARSDAAKALSAKQDERSLMLFRGDPSWRYRVNLARVNEEIEKLTAALEEVENNPPVINKEPEFKLTAANLEYSFPPAPAAGNEIRFCAEQKADAFLTGSIMDYHGRFYVTIKLYTLYTRSFVWEDSIIFSAEDMEDALGEIARRLNMVLSGNRPSAIIVKAEPQDSLVLINRSFAGRGETPLLEYPPGKFIITASAGDHESLTVETELLPGELAEVEMILKPLEYSDIQISGSSPGGVVYHGAVYVGEAPLILRLPANTLEYVELETNDSKRGAVVFTSPDAPDSGLSLSIRTQTPLKPGRVGSARRTYYWAWGGTWITGIAAWIMYYTYVSADAALSTRDDYEERFMNDNVRLYYVSMGTVIAVSVAVAYEIFHIGRYVYIANKGSTPIAKPGRH